MWDAVRNRLGLAVVDSFVVPRRDSWNFAPPPDFKVTGFFYEEGQFDPIPLEVSTSRPAVVRASGRRGPEGHRPDGDDGITRHRRPSRRRSRGDDPDHPLLRPRARRRPRGRRGGLESAFLANGLEAQSIQEVVDETIAANMTFNRLIQGFMGLGLLVGVAALGVISARAVVERRQQIGVMRAIGFRRAWAGGLPARVVVRRRRRSSSGRCSGSCSPGTSSRTHAGSRAGRTSSLVVLWLNLAIIFVVVYAVALLATLAPAVRVAHPPAEALQGQ